MRYLAHSARDGCPEQTYQKHVEHVGRDACRNAEEAAKYAEFDGGLLIESVKLAAAVHDLGKLDRRNQEALRQGKNRGSLPIPHQDAGVLFLKNKWENSLYAQLAVSAHHKGLPDLNLERGRRNNCFRDPRKAVRDKVRAEIAELSALHQNLIGKTASEPSAACVRGDDSVFFRLLLSCLADADHTDTAVHYRKYPQAREVRVPKLKAEERLKRLDAYEASLFDESERGKLRRETYWACRDSAVDAGIVSCENPGGSANLTAWMAYALSKAASCGARRIFVVLPYINMIEQAVEIYRKALCMSGENSEEVVAKLHYRADFENEEARALTAQWKAPIVVTTAAAFFETLASCMPGGLRRLHELPGSVILVNEVCAALPVKLLPTAWHWMQVFADEWSCRWVLASGASAECWKWNQSAENSRTAPPIMPSELRERWTRYEANRVQYLYRREPLSSSQLVRWAASFPGPRLIIMNTVQGAAAVAEAMRNDYGEAQPGKVMHVSAALEAEHRERTMEAVTKRLENRSDTDWTLVATSGAQAGIDLSFQTGFRELASMASLLQTASCINRNGLDDHAAVWTFEMQTDEMFVCPKNIKESSYVLRDYFQRGISISSKRSTEALEKELRRQTVLDAAERLLEAELSGCFPEVQEKFRVIDEDTVFAAADPELKEQLRSCGCDWRSMQRRAVPIRKELAVKYRLRALADGVYDWDLGYDPFLGMMRGVFDHPQ